VSADSDDVQQLAMQTLRERIAGTASASEAYNRGIDLGVELAQQRAADAARADVWSKVIDAVDRLTDKVLDRLDAAELRAEARKNPPKPAHPEEDVGIPAAGLAEVLGVVSTQPPPMEAAASLAKVGVTQTTWPTVVRHLRAASAEWAEFLDDRGEWVEQVRALVPDGEAPSEPA